MNINPASDNNNISMHGKTRDWFRRVGQKLLDKMPSHTSKESKNSVKNWNKATYWVSDPMWNRGILGATALLTQPAIDYYNHRVDDETRTVSRNRTIAKILAGTTVGMFVVRGPIYKMVEKMTNPFGTGKWDTKLLPKNYIDKLKTDANGLRNYRSTLAMAMALGAMCFTNFLLDAPLTIILTNYFNKKSGVGEHNSAKQNSTEKFLDENTEKEVNNG